MPALQEIIAPTCLDGSVSDTVRKRRLSELTVHLGRAAWYKTLAEVRLTWNRNSPSSPHAQTSKMKKDKHEYS